MLALDLLMPLGIVWLTLQVLDVADSAHLLGRQGRAQKASFSASMAYHVWRARSDVSAG